MIDLETIRYIMSSDILTFLTIAAGAYVYVVKYRPMRDEYEKLRGDLFKKIESIPTADRITEIMNDSRDAITELAVLDEHKKDIIGRLEQQVVDMKAGIFDALNIAANNQSECVAGFRDRLQNISENFERVADFTNVVRDNISRSEQRIDSIEKKLVKISTGLKVTYALLDAFISKIEEKGDVAKIDRKSIEDFKENLVISQNELSSLMEVIGKALNHQGGHFQKSSRFDKFMDDGEE